MELKMNWYATINRSEKTQDGTKIRLTIGKHLETLKFIQSKWQEVCDLHLKSSDSIPSFILNEDDWKVVCKEIGLKKGQGFTKIFSGKNEICVIAEKGYREEIMKTKVLSTDAKKRRAHEREEILRKLNKSENKLISAVRGTVKWDDLLLKSDKKKMTTNSQKALDSLLQKEIIAFDFKTKRFIETKV